MPFGRSDSDTTNNARQLDDEQRAAARFKAAHAPPVMVRLQTTKGSMVNTGGFAFYADADGVVEVPEEHVDALLSHGLKKVAVASKPT